MWMYLGICVPLEIIWRDLSSEKSGELCICTAEVHVGFDEVELKTIVISS